MPITKVAWCGEGHRDICPMQSCPGMDCKVLIVLFDGRGCRGSTVGSPTLHGATLLEVQPVISEDQDSPPSSLFTGWSQFTDIPTLDGWSSGLRSFLSPLLHLLRPQPSQQAWHKGYLLAPSWHPPTLPVDIGLALRRVQMLQGCIPITPGRYHPQTGQDGRWGIKVPRTCPPGFGYLGPQNSLPNRF